MPPRPSLPHQSKLLVTLDGKQRAAVAKAAKHQGQSMAAYIRGLIDERHPAPEQSRERLLADCLKPTHEITIRGKFLFMQCKTITDMIAALRDQAALLSEMKSDGMVLAAEGVEDDYATLVTDNATTAKKHKLERVYSEDAE